MVSSMLLVRFVYLIKDKKLFSINLIIFKKNLIFFRQLFFISFVPSARLLYSKIRNFFRLKCYQNVNVQFNFTSYTPTYKQEKTQTKIS